MDSDVHRSLLSILQRVTYFSYEYPMPDRATGRLDDAQRALVKWNLDRGDGVMEDLLLRFLKGFSSGTCWWQEVMSPSPAREGAGYMPTVCLFTATGTPTAHVVPIAEQRIRGRAMLRAAATIAMRDWTMHGELPLLAGSRMASSLSLLDACSHVFVTGIYFLSSMHVTSVHT